MHKIVIAVSLLSLGTIGAQAVAAADLSGYGYQRVHQWHYRLEPQHPSTIGGIILGNLLPEGSIYPPPSAWSDVVELKMLPPTGNYSFVYNGASDTGTDTGTGAYTDSSGTDTGTNSSTSTDVTNPDNGADLPPLPMIPSVTGSHLQ